jgi:16S rRNA (uracil1498-N3)-methyltransferase
MAKHRLFCSRRRIEDGVFTLGGEEAYHATKVLRLKPGTKINIFTEQQSEFICEIVAVAKGQLKAKILEKLENTVESSLKLNIIQGLPKAAKLEQIIVHGTELGMSRLLPVATKFSNAKGERRDRWRRLALEATKQCGRRDIPVIEAVNQLDRLDYSQFENSLKLIAAEPPYSGDLKQIISEHKEINEVTVVIGSEGGLSQEEVEMLQGHGFQTFSMGPRVLRTETASLAIASVLHYQLGDWGLLEKN